MTLVTAVLVTLVVWAVSQLRSIRWRALVYSLPLPITLVLAGTDVRVDGSQLLGVLGLVGFVAVVALLHARLRWPVAIADAAGVAAYVGLSALVAALGPVPFLPALAALCALWTLLLLVHRPGPAGVVGPVPARPGPVVKLALVFAAALLMVALGDLVKGLVVTFPYAGVLVVVETRRHLPEFARQFAHNSIALAAFFTGYYLLQDRAEPAALGAGWAAFAGAVLVLQAAAPALARLTGRSPLPPTER